MSDQRQPIFNVPNVIVALVAVFMVIFYLQSQMDEMAQMDLLRRLAFVPARISLWFDPNALASVDMDADMQSLAGFFVGDGALMPWTVLTYAFLHGSWTHVLLNCLWLMSFGAAVARRFDMVRFLVFCAVTAVAGVLMHFLVHPKTIEPVIGASAIVSGCMGASMRFAFSPGAPLGDSNGLRVLSRDGAYHLPSASIKSVLGNSRAMTFFMVWFVLNLLIGIASTVFGFGDGPIAWEAHIGGFLAGFLLFALFDTHHSSASKG